MSGPAPDWIAEVMRGCRSFALTVSKLIFMPSALVASGRMLLRKSSSEAGTKSFQRIQCTVVCWANAGAWRATRMPAMPAFRKSLRANRAISPPPKDGTRTLLLQPRFGAGVRKRGRVDQELRPASVVHRDHGGDRGAGDIAEELVGPGERMGSDDHVVQLEQRIVRRCGLLLEHVEAGARDAARRERLVQRLFIHHQPARHVDEKGARLHERELARSH